MNPALRRAARRVTAAITTIAVVAAGCNAGSTDTVEKPSDSGALTVTSVVETPVSSEPAPERLDAGGDRDVELRWYASGTSRFGHASVHGSRLFVFSEDGYELRVDAHRVVDGARQWSIGIPFGPSGLPPGEQIMYPTKSTLGAVVDDTIHVLSMDDGSTLWQRPIAGLEVVTRDQDDRIVLSSINNEGVPPALTVLDAPTGEQLARFETPRTYIHHGLLVTVGPYPQGPDAYATVIDLETLRPLASDIPLRSWDLESPTLDGDGVLVSRGREIAELDGEGRMRWSTTTDLGDVHWVVDLGHDLVAATDGVRTEIVRTSEDQVQLAWDADGAYRLAATHDDEVFARIEDLVGEAVTVRHADTGTIAVDAPAYVVEGQRPVDDFQLGQGVFINRSGEGFDYEYTGYSLEGDELFTIVNDEPGLGYAWRHEDMVVVTQYHEERPDALMVHAYQLVDR